MSHAPAIPCDSLHRSCSLHLDGRIRSLAMATTTNGSESHLSIGHKNGTSFSVSSSESLTDDMDSTHLGAARPAAGRRKNSSPLMPAFMVSAPGKVIVYGEHAVVHGKVSRTRWIWEHQQLTTIRPRSQHQYLSAPISSSLSSPNRGERSRSDSQMSPSTTPGTSMICPGLSLRNQARRSTTTTS